MKMQKMTEEEYEVFKEFSIHEVAKMRSEETDRPVNEVMDEAAAEFERYAPQGLETPEKFLYSLKSDEGINLGYLWYRLKVQGNKRSLFILDVQVYESARGKGGGKFMMKWLEGEAAKMRIPELALHVVGSNRIARGMYESLGYEITNLYMAKKISTV